MRATVFSGDGSGYYCEDYPVPTLNYGEGLVKVGSCGICGTCVHVFHGQHKTAKHPVIAGHEIVGRLEEIAGPVPPHVKVGDLVAVQPVLSCGHCSACLKGSNNVCENLGILGVHADGAYADYVKAPLDRIFSLKEDIDLSIAPLIEPLAVAVHDTRAAGTISTKTVLVLGGGPIGILIALFARYSGAGKVIISEIADYRINLAREMGFLVHDGKLNSVEEYLQETGNPKVDVAFDAAGYPAALDICIRVVRPKGKIIAVAIASDKVSIDTQQMFFSELDLRGVRLHTGDDFLSAINLVESGCLSKELKMLVSETYPLEESLGVFEDYLKDSNKMKVIIKVNDL